MNTILKNSLEFIAKNLVVAFFYFGIDHAIDLYVSGHHAIDLYFSGKFFFSPVFPSAGLALAAILWWGYRIIPGILLGAFMGMFFHTPNPMLSIIVGIGASLQAIFSAWLLQKFTHTTTPFYRQRDFMIFTFGCCFLGCLINATISMTSLYLLNYVIPHEYFGFWLTWWLGDAVGVLMMCTSMMVWHNSGIKIDIKKIYELLLLLVLLGIFTFFQTENNLLIIRIFFLFGFWAAVRLGPQITAIVCLLITVIVFEETLHGYQEFIGATVSQTMLFMQSYIAVLFFVTFLLASVINETERSKQILIRNHEVLEEKVRQRTKDLSKKNDILQNTLVELEKAQSQLVQAEKMSSLGVLTAGIAHEINNAVNFISSNISPLKNDINELIDVLKKYRNLPPNSELKANLQEISQLSQEMNLAYTVEETHKLLDGIHEGANRTTAIVKDLRTFSRIEEGELKKFDIHRNMDSTLNLLKNAYKDRILITKNYSDIPEIECYAGKINQVFMNILMNAIQAIPDKGEITIATIKNAGKVIIKIKDTGTGMSEEVVNKIFEPFFTTKAVGQGTGLGLSISYGIIQEHHGDISVASKPGEGTEFIISLPIDQDHIKN